jgi:acetyltransferase-like isoleucine patch superfamily enzyme
VGINFLVLEVYLMLRNIVAIMRYVKTKFILFTVKTKISYGTGLHIGSGTKLWAPVSIVIGKQVYIGKDVHIEANIDIGSYCLLANRVAVVGRHDHDFSRIGFPVRFSPWIASKKFPSPFINERAIIGDDVWIGYGAIILTGVNIGRGSIVAAGSVVTSDVPPYSIIAGIPARVLKKRFTNEEISSHEKAVDSGQFLFSELGYDHFMIQPGSF